MMLRLLSLPMCFLVCTAPLLAQIPVGVLSSSDVRVSGSATVVPRGLLVYSGTVIAAQKSPADLSLARGGKIRVCQGTTVTPSSSQDGSELQIGMGVGAIEANYSVGPHGDTILTPDLRINISGPGDVDLQISMDAKGNSCIDNRGVTAPLVVLSQLLGDGIYRVQPNERVLVVGGEVNHIEHPERLCGCPLMPDVPVVIQRPDGQTEAPMVFDANTAAMPSATPMATPTPLPSPTPDAAPVASPPPHESLGRRILHAFKRLFGRGGS
jgi:hypothetical protein